MSNMAFDFHAYQHRTKRPHYCSENKFFCAKHTYDVRTYSKRKDYLYTPQGLAAFKQVVIKCRSSGLSYGKIAKAFQISSRTVFNWVSKIFAIPRTLIQVNVKAIASALFSHLVALRNGWITTLNIDKIMSGDGIH